MAQRTGDRSYPGAPGTIVTNVPVATGADHPAQPEATGGDRSPKNLATGRSENQDHAQLLGENKDSVDNQQSLEVSDPLPMLAKSTDTKKPNRLSAKTPKPAKAKQPPKGAETVSVTFAADYLSNDIGIKTSPKNVQRYCTGERRPGQLKCYFHDDSNVHMVDKKSLFDFGQRLLNEISPPESSKPDPTVTHGQDDSEQEQPITQQSTILDHSIYDHPAYKKLEADYIRLEGKFDNQVATTQRLQKEHAKEMGNMMEQFLIASSDRYAQAKVSSPEPNTEDLDPTA